MSEITSLIAPSSTSAVIFITHEYTRSVLLFETDEGLSGWLFFDKDRDVIIKEKAIADLSSKTGIVVQEKNPLCLEVLQTLTGGEENIQSSWRFVIQIKDLVMPDVLPLNSKWYHLNQINFSRIRCKQERELLRELMRSQ